MAVSSKSFSSRARIVWRRLGRIADDPGRGKLVLNATGCCMVLHESCRLVSEFRARSIGKGFADGLVANDW